ncbi:unnamed protein product [Boreogadus saida]
MLKPLHRAVLFTADRQRAMGQIKAMDHLSRGAGQELKIQMDFEVEPLSIRFLRTFREVLKFVFFSYTVLFGALLLARWTTYFMVGKR